MLWRREDCEEKEARSREDGGKDYEAKTEFQSEGSWDERKWEMERRECLVDDRKADIWRQTELFHWVEEKQWKGLESELWMMREDKKMQTLKDLVGRELSRKGERKWTDWRREQRIPYEWRKINTEVDPVMLTWKKFWSLIKIEVCFCKE